MTAPRPKIGDEIYVATHLYISHGRDDVVGGRARVTRVDVSTSGGEPCAFVTVAEHPGHSYNWDQMLSQQQDELAKEFGDKRAYPDPDYHDYGVDW